MRLALLAGLCLFPCTLSAGEAAKPGEKFVSLFDGKTLDGWKVEHCKAEVKDGCIFLEAGNGWVRTDKQYGDFVLELEWKAVKPQGYDSGVYIRAVPPIGKQNWPAKNQVNLRQDLVGNISEIKEAVARTDLVKQGEWNQFRLTVIGPSAALEINGKPAWKINSMKPPVGYIGLQCEVPGGGQFYFRSIRISER